MTNIETNMDGYKKTKLGWIPEDWSVLKLSDLGTFKNGMNKSKEEYGSGLPFVNLMDVFGKSVVEFDNLGFVETTENDLRKYSLKKGDVLFVRSSVKPSGVGLSALVQSDIENITYSGFLIRFRDKGKFDLSFKKYCFYEPNFRHRLMSKSTVSANTNINQNSLGSLQIALPPKNEQKKIAEILSTWDEAIQKTEALIKKKEKLKKGLMQQLLTGKRRLPGFEAKWKEVKLGDCILGKGNYGINAPSTNYSEDLPVYLRITDIDERGKFLKENKTSVDDENYRDYLLEEGDIVFARTGNTTGKTYLYDKEDGELVYAGFLIRFKPDPADLSPKFLKYYTDTHRYWYWVSVMSARSGQPGINSTEYSKLAFKIPSIEEQKKIVDVIDHVYEEITELGLLKEKFQKQKKGLMQQLLTGKTRVTIN
ncbi:MAG: restriction endonuclease subunit S [Balneola sp.]